MPKSAKAVTVLLGLVSLNASLVIWSVLDRYAFAQPKQISAPVSEEASSSKTTVEELTVTQPNGTASVSQPPNRQQLLDSVPLPSPEQLPIVAPPLNLDEDAGFQQFLRQAADVFPGLADSQLLGASSTPAGTAQPLTERLDSGHQRTIPAFESIEARLEIVSQLNLATLGLTRDARRSASAGDLQRTEELMENVTYLRQLTAKLLLEPDR